jgi:hypothetical protein
MLLIDEAEISIASSWESMLKNYSSMSMLITAHQGKETVRTHEFVAIEMTTAGQAKNTFRKLAFDSFELLSGSYLEVYVVGCSIVSGIPFWTVIACGRSLLTPVRSEIGSGNLQGSTSVPLMLDRGDTRISPWHYQLEESALSSSSLSTTLQEHLHSPMSSQLTLTWHIAATGAVGRGLGEDYFSLPHLLVAGPIGEVWKRRLRQWAYPGNRWEQRRDELRGYIMPHAHSISNSSSSHPLDGGSHGSHGSQFHPGCPMSAVFDLRQGSAEGKSVALPALGLAIGSTLSTSLGFSFTWPSSASPSSTPQPLLALLIQLQYLKFSASTRGETLWLRCRMQDSEGLKQSSEAWLLQDANGQWQAMESPPLLPAALPRSQSHPNMVGSGTMTGANSSMILTEGGTQQPQPLQPLQPLQPQPQYRLCGDYHSAVSGPLPESWLEVWGGQGERTASALGLLQGAFTVPLSLRGPLTLTAKDLPSLQWQHRHSFRLFALGLAARHFSHFSGVDGVASPRESHSPLLITAALQMLTRSFLVLPLQHWQEKDNGKENENEGGNEKGSMREECRPLLEWIRTHQRKLTSSSFSSSSSPTDGALPPVKVITQWLATIAADLSVEGHGPRALSTPLLQQLPILLEAILLLMDALLPSTTPVHDATDSNDSSDSNDRNARDIETAQDSEPLPASPIAAFQLGRLSSQLPLLPPPPPVGSAPSFNKQKQKQKQVQKQVPVPVQNQNQDSSSTTPQPLRLLLEAAAEDVGEQAVNYLCQAPETLEECLPLIWRLSHLQWLRLVSQVAQQPSDPHTLLLMHHVIAQLQQSAAAGQCPLPWRVPIVTALFRLPTLTLSLLTQRIMPLLLGESAPGASFSAGGISQPSHGAPFLSEEALLLSAVNTEALWEVMWKYLIPRVILGVPLRDTNQLWWDSAIEMGLPALDALLSRSDPLWPHAQGCVTAPVWSQAAGWCGSYPFGPPKLAGVVYHWWLQMAPLITSCFHQLSPPVAQEVCLAHPNAATRVWMHFTLAYCLTLAGVASHHYATFLTYLQEEPMLMAFPLQPLATTGGGGAAGIGVTDSTEPQALISSAHQKPLLWHYLLLWGSTHACWHLCQSPKSSEKEREEENGGSEAAVALEAWSLLLQHWLTIIVNAEVPSETILPLTLRWTMTIRAFALLFHTAEDGAMQQSLVANMLPLPYGWKTPPCGYQYLLLTQLAGMVVWLPPWRPAERRKKATMKAMKTNSSANSANSAESSFVPWDLAPLQQWMAVCQTAMPHPLDAVFPPGLWELALKAWEQPTLVPLTQLLPALTLAVRLQEGWAALHSRAFSPEGAAIAWTQALEHLQRPGVIDTLLALHASASLEGSMSLPVVDIPSELLESSGAWKLVDPAEIELVQQESCWTLSSTLAQMHLPAQALQLSSQILQSYLLARNDVSLNQAAEMCDALASWADTLSGGTR